MWSAFISALAWLSMLALAVLAVGGVVVAFQIGGVWWGCIAGVGGVVVLAALLASADTYL